MKKELESIKNLTDGKAQKILSDIYIDFYKIGRNDYSEKDFIRNLKKRFGEGFVGDSIY